MPPRSTATGIWQGFGQSGSSDEIYATPAGLQFVQRVFNSSRAIATDDSTAVYRTARGRLTIAFPQLVAIG
ncbi:MAG: hypothetical protein ACAF42_12425 [Limnothrix sp. BL-A-16]